MDGYVKRPGSEGSGREYEIKITALLALRCALRKDAQDIWLGSNLDQVGNFDDVVLFKQNTDGVITAYLIQLKHQDVPKNIKQRDFTSSAKGAPKDFYLAKYYEGYVKLKNKLLDCQHENESLIIRDLKRAHKIVFVIYTNRGVNTFNLLEGYSDDGLLFLNTGMGANMYKFTSPLDYGPFLQDLVLLTDQCHVNDTDRLIINEVKSVVGNNDDLNAFVEKFTTFIRSWAKDRSVCQPLMKTDIVNQVTDLLLQHFKLGLAKEPYTSYNCPMKLIWNELVSQKVLTVVESSQQTLNFLKAYVGSELRNYCNSNVKTWLDVLKQSHKELKNRNIKIIDLRSTLTVIDVYRYLWFSNNVPLLLQIETIEDYKNILRILKLSAYSKRVILVTKVDVSTLVKSKIGHFLNLADLGTEGINRVLAVPVKLQGRGPIPLGNIVDESMHSLIKSADIIDILSGTYSIGDYYKELPDFFVERYIEKLLIQLEIFEFSKDCFLIEDNLGRLQERDNTVLVATQEEALMQLPQLREKYHRVHWLKYDQNLEWLQSFGEVSMLKSFAYSSPGHTKSVNGITSPVNILSASPGMGKSIVLDYVAQNTPVNKWVVRVNLAELENKTLDTVVESSLGSNRELAVKVFQKMKSENNVVALLDGFDEVSIHQQDMVLSFAKSLVDNGLAIWMTTRPFLKTNLEEAFGTLAITLVPFTIDDQKNFLTKYFGQISDAPEHQTILKNFVEELLSASQKNLLDWDYEFTGIPLQTKLLADVFYQDCQKSLALGTATFNRSFNLVFLYEEFIQKKLDIMTEKFGRTAIDMRMLFEHHQKLFALSTVFPHVYLKSLEINQKLKELYHNDQYKMQLMQREGILVVNSGTVKFVHRTFAEYLAAQWLSENPAEKDLMRLRFLGQYTFLFHLLDRILSKNNALFLSVINSKPKDALKLVQTQQELVDWTDACGRNIVHLIALYGFHHKSYQHYNKITEPLLDVLRAIQSVDQLALQPDIALTYTPLEYAIASWSLSIANYLSQYNTVINAEMDHYRKDAYFAHCANLGYLSLFRVLLLYFSAREILYIRNTAVNTVASQFLDSSNIGMRDHEKICRFAKKIYQQPLKELFKYKYVQDESDEPDYYYDLRFAASFGTKDNVQYLLDKGSDVNKQDVDKNTSLHYACINGQMENVQVLLENGAKINMLNVNNNSPLHYTIRRDFPEIAELLLKNGANPNFQNRNNFTVLHFAMTCGHKKSLVELMLKRGIEPNLQNNKLNSALHYAAQMDYSDILLELIKLGGNVNLTNYNNESPLFFATSFKNVDSALVLLSKGARVDLRNKNGETVLNIAAGKGCRKLVEEFIVRGVDVNNVDMDGDSPLSCALLEKHFEVAKLLWDNGADGNVRNNDGYYPLHLIAGADVDWLLEMLKKVDVNARTGTNDTALHLALSANKINNALILLDNGADVNVANENGNTPLHVAAFMGDAQILSVMLQNCRDCDTSNRNGETPLLIALKTRHIACANLLIPNCDVNTESVQGTALHYAVKKCNVDVVQFLIDNHAEINLCNSAGQTPLHVAVTVMLDDSHPIIENCYAVIRLLLDAGAQVNAKDDLGNTAIYYVSRFNSVFLSQEVGKQVCKTVGQMLMDKGAENVVNHQGEAAFNLKKHSCHIS